MSLLNKIDRLIEEAQSNLVGSLGLGLGLAGTLGGNFIDSSTASDIERSIDQHNHDIESMEKEASTVDTSRETAVDDFNNRVDHANQRGVDLTNRSDTFNDATSSGLKYGLGGLAAGAGAGLVIDSFRNRKK